MPMSVKEGRFRKSAAVFNEYQRPQVLFRLAFLFRCADSNEYSQPRSLIWTLITDGTEGAGLVLSGLCDLVVPGSSTVSFGDTPPAVPLVTLSPLVRQRGKQSVLGRDSGSEWRWSSWFPST